MRRPLYSITATTRLTKKQNKSKNSPLSLGSLVEENLRSLKPIDFATGILAAEKDIFSSKTRNLEGCQAKKEECSGGGEDTSPFICTFAT